MDPNSGYMTDFIDVHVAPYMSELKAKGVKFIANAGALNPRGLAKAWRSGRMSWASNSRSASSMATTCATASTHCVRGASRHVQRRGFSRHGAQHNAYLGGFPIAAALAEARTSSSRPRGRQRTDPRTADP